MVERGLEGGGHAEEEAADAKEAVVARILPARYGGMGVVHVVGCCIAILGSPAAVGHDHPVATAPREDNGGPVRSSGLSGRTSRELPD